MNRFFLEPDCIQDEQVTFPPDIAHQIRHVLRMKEGQLVSVLDNTGWVYEVVLNKITNKLVGGRVREKQTVDTEPQIHLVLYLSLTQREKFEWALQKGTEVGVGSFVPVISTRSLVRSKNKADEKQQRWLRIIREAAEQSGRSRLPALHQPQALVEAVQNVQKEQIPASMLWEGARDLSLQQWLEKGEVRGEEASPDKIGIFIGPEGGYTEQEVGMAQDAGIQPVSLGRRILRMETAAIVGAAIVLNAFDELS